MTHPLRTLHRLSAALIGLFLALHITNHLVGLAGQEAHMGFMHVARRIYRNAFIEPTLLALLVWQGLSGGVMVIRGWRARRGGVAWLQAISGLYLAAFMLLHVSAVLYGRAALHLDTDFRYAAAGFQVPPWGWWFGPYYFLAVAALFAHLGCALYWNLPARNRGWALAAALTAGILAAGLIIVALAGALHPVDIPALYLRTYGGGDSGTPT